MSHEILNTSTRTKAVKVYGGSIDIKPGETGTVDEDLAPDYIEALEAHGLVFDPEPAPEPAAKHKRAKAKPKVETDQAED